MFLTATVDGRNPATVEVGSLSHYFQYSIASQVLDFFHQQHVNVDTNMFLFGFMCDSHALYINHCKYNGKLLVYLQHMCINYRRWTFGEFVHRIHTGRLAIACGVPTRGWELIQVRVKVAKTIQVKWLEFRLIIFSNKIGPRGYIITKKIRLINLSYNRTTRIYKHT